MYREAIRIGEKSKSRDRSPKFLATRLNEDETAVLGLEKRKAGDLMDRHLKTAKENLEKLSNQNISFGNDGFVPAPLNGGQGQRTRQQLRSDGTTMPVQNRHTRISLGPDADSWLSREDASKLLSVGGDACDCCRKARQELGMAHLDACSRCKVGIIVLFSIY
jgi:hypothetical protein